MLLRLKKWLIQKRIFSMGNTSIKLLADRVINMPSKSFYIPESYNERWRIGENPELKKSVFYQVMKCVSRDTLPLPKEQLEDYLTNPAKRMQYSLTFLDTEALEELERKLSSE